MRPYLVRVLTAALAVTSCLAPACGSGDEEGAAPASAPSSASPEWGVRMFVRGPDGVEKLVLVPPSPVSEASDDETSDHPGSAQGSTSSRILADIDTPAGKSSVKLDAGPLQWALLRGAAQACGVGRPPKPPPGAPSNAFLLGDTVDPGSDPQASFVFRPAVAVGPSCDRYTAYQETWLCVAQKLEDVASAVTDQVWDIPGLPDLPGPWRLPVQSTRDQFILRDQAIFTLAHLAYTDLFALTSVASGATQPITAVCSDLYAKASKDSAFAKANEAMLFESSYSGGTPPYFPPLPAAGALPSSLGTPAHLANQARARLAFKAHILRASGRLLEKVVRKSVFADLAGAEAIRARATDPRAGNRAAWGIDAPNAVTLASRDPRYNSLSHAIRVLGGRWELTRVFNPPPSTSAVTPQNCAGIAPIALLARAYGYDLDARHDRRPATTGGQRDAMMLIGDAGIVLDPATLVDGAWSDVVGGGTRLLPE